MLQLSLCMRVIPLLSARSQEKRGPLHAAESRRERPGEARLLPGGSAEVRPVSHPQAPGVRSLHQQVGETRRHAPARFLHTHLCVSRPRRAVCFLKLNRFEEAKQECDRALRLEPNNRKAFYRRALAHKGLQVPSARSNHTPPLVRSVLTRLLFRGQDYLSASSDLQEVLQLDPNVREAEQELETVTGLLRRSLMEDSGENAPKVQI